MRFPNKITSYKESVFALFPAILTRLSQFDISPSELFEAIKKQASPSEFIEALDCLFILKKIKLDLQKGVLHYVA